MNWIERQALKIASSVLKGASLDYMSTGTTQAVSRYLQKSNAMRYINGTGIAYQTACYNYCPPLQFIIGKRAKALTRGEIIPVNPQTKEVIKSPAFQKDMQLLNRPNKYQSRNEFLSMMETFVCTYGVCYVYKIIPIGFKDPTGFVIIPNTCITPMYRTNVNILDPAQSIIDYYQVSIYGYTFTLRGEDAKLIHEVRDSVINTTHALQPKSRLDTLEYNVKNIVASLESRNQIIVKRGAEIVLSPKQGDKAAIMTAMTPTEKKDLQDEYAQYGSLADQWHALISRVPMDAQNISRSVQQLGLFEGENADTRALAQAYELPVPLLSIPDTNKYSTYQEAKKEFYDDTIIPESQVICDTLDVLFNSISKGYSFYFDYSNLSCMQISEKAKADSLKVMVEAMIAAESAGYVQHQDAVNQINDFLN